MFGPRILCLNTGTICLRIAKGHYFRFFGNEHIAKPFAIMTRKLKLIKGSQLKILKEVKLTLKIMNNCVKVDAEYPDEK